jgi:putative DNA primase/helicase
MMDRVEHIDIHDGQVQLYYAHKAKKEAARNIKLIQETGAAVTLVRGSDLAPEPICWAWRDWIATGKVHLLGGYAGEGKTTLAIGFAATVTSAGRWPDGSSISAAGNVALWSGEDDPCDTLTPRLMLSGADMRRIYFINGVVDADGERAFDPAWDMAPLAARLRQIGNVKLLIIDPIVSAIAGDSHKNAEVRRGLQPLADLAASVGCAVVGITHFSKATTGRNPVERITGSLAFGAVARVVMVAARHQEQGQDGKFKRLLLRAKSNIGPDTGGFEYDLHQQELDHYPGIFASCVRWGNAMEGTARELLALADATATDDDGEGGTLADAKRFLSDLLADGPLPTKVIKADADGAGYSWATIRRAQKALGVEAVKAGMKEGWNWALRGRCSEDAQQENVSAFAKFERLRSENEKTTTEVSKGITTTETPKALKNPEDAHHILLGTFDDGNEHLPGAAGDDGDGKNPTLHKTHVEVDHELRD